MKTNWLSVFGAIWTVWSAADWTHSPVQYRESRSQYFRDLFRIQAELVQLQDWVVKTGHEVVILFEGGDAVRKGCVIKRITRITQRLNPRVC